MADTRISKRLCQCLEWEFSSTKIAIRNIAL